MSAQAENTHALLVAFIESQGLDIVVTDDKYRIDIESYEITGALTLKGR